MKDRRVLDSGARMRLEVLIEGRDAVTSSEAARLLSPPLTKSKQVAVGKFFAGLGWAAHRCRGEAGVGQKTIYQRSGNRRPGQRFEHSLIPAEGERLLALLEGREVIPVAEIVAALGGGRSHGRMTAIGRFLNRRGWTSMRNSGATAGRDRYRRVRYDQIEAVVDFAASRQPASVRISEIENHLRAAFPGQPILARYRIGMLMPKLGYRRWKRRAREGQGKEESVYQRAAPASLR